MPHSALLAGCGTENLKLGEQLLLWSLRSWVSALREERCPLCEITEPFALIKAEPVAEALHRAFLLLLRPTGRGLVVQVPRCGIIGEAESRILLAAGAAYHSDEPLACRLLSGIFKPDTAADLAAALRALAVLLARHGLALPQRLPPVTRLVTPLGDYGSPAGLAQLH